MKIKQKILLSLSMLVVMIGTAFAGSYREYTEMVSIKSVSVPREKYCTLSFISESFPNIQQSGDWWCGNLHGIMILDLAIAALHLERPVVVVFRDNGEKVKQVLGINLKLHEIVVENTKRGKTSHCSFN